MKNIILLITLFLGINLSAQIHIHDNGRGIEFPGALQYNTGYFGWNMSENGSNYYDLYFTQSEAIFYQGFVVGAIAGDRSTSQSVMVAVGDSLYVFYNDDYDQTQQAYYSVVDMTTQTLVRTVNLGSQYNEKITFEQHCDPDYFYVLHQRCNGLFEVRLVDSTGVSLHSTFNSGEPIDPLLCIGCAKIRDGHLISSNFGTDYVAIYPFTNGNVGIRIEDYIIPNAYGVELIGNDAYVGERTFSGRVWHLDYTTGDSTVIATTGSTSQIGQMTRGDGKVYVARFTLGNFFEITPPQSVSTWGLGFSGASLGISQSYDTCSTPMLLWLDTTKTIFVEEAIDEPKEWCRLFTIHGQLVYTGIFDRVLLPDLPAGIYVRMNKWNEIDRIIIR